MTYLAQTAEGLDLGEDASYMRKLQDGPGEGASAPSSSPGGGGGGGDIGLCCVPTLDLYTADNSTNTAGGVVDMPAEDSIVLGGEGSGEDADQRAKISYYFSYAVVQHLKDSRAQIVPVDQGRAGVYGGRREHVVSGRTARRHAPKHSANTSLF